MAERAFSRVGSFTPARVSGAVAGVAKGSWTELDPPRSVCPAAIGAVRSAAKLKTSA